MAATSSTDSTPAQARPQRRQPRDGGDPVGVSSSTNPITARAISVSGAYTGATRPAAGSDPGRTTTA
jgi:hypothetical protein